MLGRHLCAPYIVMRNGFQKRLQAPKGGGSRLPEVAPEPLMCRAVSRSLWWLLCLDMLGPTPQGGSRSRQCVAAPRVVAPGI